MGISEGETMPKIYERNPDTGEIREREFLMYDEDGMFTTEHLQGDTEMAIKPEEDPYRNYAKEAIDILERIHQKVDVLLEKQKEHLKEGHPRDDGK